MGFGTMPFIDRIKGIQVGMRTVGVVVVVVVKCRVSEVWMRMEQRWRAETGVCGLSLGGTGRQTGEGCRRQEA